MKNKGESERKIYQIPNSPVEEFPLLEIKDPWQIQNLYQEVHQQFQPAENRCWLEIDGAMANVCIDHLQISPDIGLLLDTNKILQ